MTSTSASFYFKQYISTYLYGDHIVATKLELDEHVPAPYIIADIEREVSRYLASTNEVFYMTLYLVCCTSD